MVWKTIASTNCATGPRFSFIPSEPNFAYTAHTASYKEGSFIEDRPKPDRVGSVGEIFLYS